jgi:hypothetical protein
MQKATINAKTAFYKQKRTHSFIELGFFIGERESRQIFWNTDFLMKEGVN